MRSDIILLDSYSASSPPPLDDRLPHSTASTSFKKSVHPQYLHKLYYHDVYRTHNYRLVSSKTPRNTELEKKMHSIIPTFNDSKLSVDMMRDDHKPSKEPLKNINVRLNI
jgi:hypothetical protein